MGTSCPHLKFFVKSSANIVQYSRKTKRRQGNHFIIQIPLQFSIASFFVRKGQEHPRYGYLSFRGHGRLISESTTHPPTPFANVHASTQGGNLSAQITPLPISNDL